MIPRSLEPTLRKVAAAFPVVTLTGPRQSGKTTLVRAVFADRPYVSLEDLDVRSFARDDPRRRRLPRLPARAKPCCVRP